LNFIWISSAYSFIKKIASTTEEQNVRQEEALPSPELVEGFSKNHHGHNKEISNSIIVIVLILGIKRKYGCG
jgi:hypothetical protein